MARPPYLVDIPLLQVHPVLHSPSFGASVLCLSRCCCPAAHCRRRPQFNGQRLRSCQEVIVSCAGSAMGNTAPERDQGTAPGHVDDNRPRRGGGTLPFTFSEPLSMSLKSDQQWMEIVGRPSASVFAFSSGSFASTCFYLSPMFS